MKKLTIICALLLLCLIALFAAAENNLWYAYLTEDGNILVADFTYQGERISELTLGKGEERYVSVIGTDYVSFYSTGSYVAQIEEDGTLITGDPGESKLRVYVTPTYYVEIKVTVKKAPSSITLNKSNATVYLGSTETLSYTLSKNSVGTVSFLSSDDSVAWVDEHGTVHPVKEGSCVITAATYNNRTAECAVTVELPAPAKVITGPCTGYAQENVTIPCTLDGGWNEHVTYVSSDESVLTVSEDGTASCLKAGTADVTITASRGGSAVCRVQVLPCASAITVSEPTVYLYEGGLYRPEARTNGGSGSFEITSRDEEITEIEDGAIKGVKPGSAVIELVAPGGAKTAFTLVVLPCPETLIFHCPDSVAMGEQVGIELGSSAYPLPKTVFSSSDESVLTVSPDGILSGMLPGTAVLTAEIGKLSFSKTITVDFMAKSMRFAKESITLSPGDSLKPAIEMTDGIGQVSYSSTNESVVTVDGGVITAVGTGSAQVLATLKNGVSAAMSVTVNPAPAAIRFKAATVTIGRGDSFTPGYEFENGHIALLYWSSSDEAIASVSSEGMVRAHGRDGICTVTAETNRGVSASFRVIVSGNPGLPEMNAASVTQEGLFTHYLTLKQGSEYDLGLRFPGYDSVSYRCTVKDKDLLTLSDDGIIKAVKPGIARVTITVYSGVTAELMVEITE